MNEGIILEYMKYLPLLTGVLSMATTLPFTKDKHDTPTNPMERSKHTTIKPENKDQPASVNILRVVRDHSPATIAELEDQIIELKDKLQEKERELEYNVRLKTISDEYFS